MRKGMKSISSSTSQPQLLRIGDLARMSGKTVRAIHLYEELGLLRPAKRSSGGFRLYEAPAIDRLRWIDLLHGMGFSLHEMRELLQKWWGTGLGSKAMAELRGLFQRKLEATREAIRRHEGLERELLNGLAYLEACRVCSTPASAVTGCVHCKQDHGMTGEPALVAGITTSPGHSRNDARAAMVRIEDIG
jgi:MerR family copper efflux transcriptional regulator